MPNTPREEELLALNEIFMEIQSYIYEIHELFDISKTNILQILRNLLAQQRAATERRMREEEVRLLEKIKAAIFDKDAERHELDYDAEDLIDQALRELKERK